MKRHVQLFASFGISLSALACGSADSSTDPSTNDASGLKGGCGDAGAVVVVDPGLPSTDASPPSDAGTSKDAAPSATSTRWMPKPGTSWQWQLSGTGGIDTSFNVQMYDIDLFDTPVATIDALHAAGRKVVCYFDTAYEPGRPDSAQLAPYKHNAVMGWPGQYWLDVRVPVVVSVMKTRIALAAQHGCDGIEADDVDSFSNSPGTGITAAEQQAFIRALAAEAHAKGMSYALKSDIADGPAVLDDVDFVINEECFTYNECDALLPFIKAGKAVFDVEYTAGDLASKGASVCTSSNALGFDTLIKHLDLGAPRYSCK